ncbi:MAG: hypothetical protein IKJ04_04630 [Clostridia bacterium]|nr:hypothetical protein [Clostridia bacterium]
MKKNSTILRLIAMLVLSVMMISAFASCANTGDGTTTTEPEANNAGTTAPSGEEATSSDVDEQGYKLDDLPELNFGSQINILAWKDVEHEEFDIAYEDLSGDIVEQSLYDRNVMVEERLGLTLNFIRTVDGDADFVGEWNAYVNNSVSISAREFDIIAGYSLSMAACAVNGYLYNMLDDTCEYLNFDQPWWSELLLEQATFGDNLYFASGDISRNALEMMYVCYANTDILEKYQLSNPQELVESGDWTYDKFIEMCQGIYEDDGDGIKNCTNDTGDTFGYITSGIHVDPWFYGSGATICERNADGEIVESPSFSGERVANTIDKLCNLLEGEYAIYTENDSGKAKVYHQRAFGQGRSLFMMDRARVSHKVLAADYGETKFVILPCPKYDKDQEKYITVMGNPFTLYAIALDIADPAMASAFIECFASEGYRKVTPAVFEISLKTRYVDDALSGRMYDIIRANITYDVGRIFSDALIGQSNFRNAVQNHQSWGSIAKQASMGLKKSLVTLNKALDQ